MNTVAKPPKPKLVWWNVSLMRAKAERIGMVQAPAGDRKAAMTAAVKAFKTLTEAQKKKLLVQQA